MLDSNSISGGGSYLKGLVSASSNKVSVAQFSAANNGMKAASTIEEKKEVAQKFEAMFIGSLMKLMLNTVPVDENFGGGYGEETFREMLTDEYGNLMSKAGGIGVADSIMKSLIGAQGDKQVVNADKSAASYAKVYSINNK